MRLAVVGRVHIRLAPTVAPSVVAWLALGDVREGPIDMITSVWPLVAWRWPCLCDVCACVGADLVLVRIAIVGREPIARARRVASSVAP